MSLLLNNKKYNKLHPNLRRIAIVKGGKSDGKIVYFSENIGEGEKEIILDGSGILQPLPDYQKYEKLYAAANSGAGKTYYIANWLKEWYTKPANKNKPLYIFSAVEEDATLDDFPNSKRIPIDEDLIEDPITLEDLSDSFIIFDDIDTISNPTLRKIVLNLRDHALQAGRHYGVTMASTSHVVSNYKQTRILIQEATSITVFPRSSGTFQIRQYLEKQAGFDKGQIEKFIKQPSRWVTLYKQYNAYVISEKSVYMVNNY